ncbi:MAG: ABC transporter substrate-binding protein [Prevotella sp.]|nr:ABC transporter substrate-binding protein [Prevotella sp.]
MGRTHSLLAFLLSLLLFSCKDSDDTAPSKVAEEVTTINIDIVLPASIQSQWQNTIQMAMANIEMAQQVLPNKVKLKLRYHDEDTEDLEQLAYSLTHPQEGEDTCHAIIGPYHSDHASIFLNYAAATCLPVVMPTCTSVELQRIHTKSTYAWFLTESDVTQCEIMLTAVNTMNVKNVALIYSDNTYGKSFYDYFGFFATEHDMKIVGEGMTAYREEEPLDDFFQAIFDETANETVAILLALSDAREYIDVWKQMQSFMDTASGQELNVITCSADVSLCDEIISYEKPIFNIGFCPAGAMNYGFPQSYEIKFGRLPYNGEPQIYDALSIIAYGAALRMASPNECYVNNQLVKSPTLTDYMRSVVDESGYANTIWDTFSMADAFSMLAKGLQIDPSGATGDLVFDYQTLTKILQTTYMMWATIPNYDSETDSIMSNHIVPLSYLTISDYGSSSSVKAVELWQREKNIQSFDLSVSVDHQLPDVKDHWAVVISPSTSWNNYRHQADAFAMYQTLRRHGYDDDHIILIVEDNLANDPRNSKYAGRIFVDLNEDSYYDVYEDANVRLNAVVDYHFSDLTFSDIDSIMLGRQSQRLPHVIHPDSASNVFVFWSGHGGRTDGPLWGNEDAGIYFGSAHIDKIVTEMNKSDMYRRMMFAIETCFSGIWGETLTGQPDVLVLTSANADESSKADIFSKELGVFLSNAFARTFREMITFNYDISIYDIYINQLKTTNGSHVSLYNEKEYGSVYTNSMTDFFPQ